MRHHSITEWTPIIIALAFTGIALSQPTFWEQTPGPSGGTILALAVGGNQRLFAGTQGAGVFVSTDAGEHWQSLNSGLTNLHILSLAVDANGQLFAGADNKYLIDGALPGGLFSSKNGGASWDLADFDGMAVRVLAIGPGGEIYAGVGDNGPFGPSPSAPYRSTNGGENWTAIKRFDLLSIAFGSNGYVFAGSSYGVVRSSDSGATWSPALSPPYGINALVALANGVIFAGTHENGVIRSMDNGESWSQINSGLDNLSITALFHAGEGHLFAGTRTAGGVAGGVYGSTDNGDHWIRLGEGLASVEILSLIGDTSGNLFAGTFGGVYRSTNAGQSWSQANNGISNTTVTAFGVNANGQVLAGGNYIGFSLSTNQGNTWKAANAGLAMLPVTVYSIAASSQYWFAATFDGIFRAPADVSQWTAINAGLTNVDYVYAIAAHPSGQIFAGTDEFVFRSTDNGENWARVGNSFASVQSLTISADGELWAGTYGGVYHSTDLGAHWTLSGIGQSSSEVFALAFNSRGDLFAATRESVFRSIDKGAHWTGSTPDYGIQALAIDSQDRLYAGTLRGAFRSDDNGDSWTAINEGLNNRDVLALTISPQNVLFAGTRGSGVFRSISPVLAVEHAKGGIRTTYSLGQNYPNPFNPSTTIQFSLPQSGHVTLKIYNALGEEVATLVEGSRSVGIHQVVWDAANVSGGVYFYRLRAGEFVETKKLLLIK